MITIKTFINAPIDENTYVVSDETREAVIIDCGALRANDQQAIADYIRQEGLTIKHHLLTHGHFDHSFGAQRIADDCNVLPLVHTADAAFYQRGVEMASALFHRPMPYSIPPLGGTFAEGDTIAFGTHTLRVIHTPGHTPGGVCLYCAEEDVVFTGDTLFYQSIGRADLEGGDPRTIMRSLQERVLALPDTTKVYPGHGPASTIGDERLYNPYLYASRR